jgi:hypothetical protein
MSITCTIETTAEALCQALYGESVSCLNRGCYEGTNIPVRQVPADAPVTLKAWSGGGSVTDQEGQWIADRFGPGLGHREAQRAAKALK